MSAKRSRSTAPDQTDSPRPTAFFLAVLFAAAVSTWHWYRPLPPRASETASGSAFVSQPPWQSDEFPKPKTKWKDSGLIFPSEQNDETSPPRDSISEAVQPEPPSVYSLTGSRDLALEPFRESTRPLNESVAAKPLPMVPVKQPGAGQPPTPSQGILWTTASIPRPSESTHPDPVEGSNSRTDGVADGASPFRVPRINSTLPTKEPTVSMRSDIWPDQGFKPNLLNSIAPSEPQLADKGSSSLALPSDVFSVSNNRIRTMDQESERLPVASAPPSPSALKTTSPVRGPVIRQPVSKDPAKQ